MDTKTLFQLSADMAAIEDALWENGGELTDELALALQDTEAGLSRKADGYTSLIRSFGAQKEIIKAEIDRLTKLKRVAENAEKRLKEHLCNTMGMFGIDKIEGDKSKITRTRSQAMETDDATLTFSYDGSLADLNATLPPYITAEFKISKTALKEYIKDTGITPNGAAFVENWSVRIR